MFNKETEYFCFNHSKAFLKEEISCPECCNDLAELNDPFLVGKRKWFEEAEHYFYKLGVFTKDESSEVLEIVESLWYNSENDKQNPENWLSAKAAVNEEMSYWK